MLPRLFRSIHTSMRETLVTELLAVNQKTKKYGVQLTAEDIRHLIDDREQLLHSYGRVELGVDVTKRLAETFCTSPYIDRENVTSVLYDLHEIFYYVKNETEDAIGDITIIEKMKDYFDSACGGSLELLKSKMETFVEDYRSDALLKGSLYERDEGEWHQSDETPFQHSRRKET